MKKAVSSNLKNGNHETDEIAAFKSTTERRDLVKHIYHSLISIYTALFRTESPLLFDWRKDETYDMLGRNQTLIYDLVSIEAEMLWLCELFSF